MKGWTFLKSEKSVQIILRVNEEAPYLHLNRNQKVTFVEQVHWNYTVLGIQAMTEKGEDLPHCHSIIVKVGDTHGQFDFCELLECVLRNGQGSLRDAFEKYIPWNN